MNAGPKSPMNVARMTGKSAAVRRNGGDLGPWSAWHKTWNDLSKCVGNHDYDEQAAY